MICFINLETEEKEMKNSKTLIIKSDKRVEKIQPEVSALNWSLDCFKDNNEIEFKVSTMAIIVKTEVGLEKICEKLEDGYCLYFRWTDFANLYEEELGANDKQLVQQKEEPFWVIFK